MFKSKWFAILILGLIVVIGVLLLEISQKNKTEKISLTTPWGVFTGKEVPGEDLTCIGRYDNMIRGAYSKKQIDNRLLENIVYYKKGDIYESAKDYFVSQIKKCGYKKESDYEGPLSMPKYKISKRYTASYKKDGEKILLTVGVLESGNTKYTLAVINYSHLFNKMQKFSNKKSVNFIKVNIGNKSKKLDNMIRPILITIFGKVDLIEGSEMQMGPMKLSRLTYHLKRNLNKKDVNILENSLKKVLKDKGYNLIQNKMEGSKFIMTFTKNRRPVLIIEGEINKPIIYVRGVI